MIAVEFKDVVNKFKGANYNALDDVSFTAEHGEFITILGSSGCGKTTLLKCINSLVEPTSGEVEIFGNDIKNENPVLLRRKIGYVIQQASLFPHMTVFQNIATVPKILKWDKEKIKERVDFLMNLIELDPREFEKRYPKELSGGQAQRVGLARALAADPDIMLLDEPFGAIDAITRESLQNEIIKIFKQCKKTFFFVTHDVHEAVKLGTKMIVMDKGKIVQYAVPEEIVKNPNTEFVAELTAGVQT
jgi:osmoprotectant transport system ATP-binding protein